MMSTSYRCLMTSMIVCIGFGFITHVQAQVGFAWAERQTTARYTPNEVYSYNEAGGRIVIRREDTGHYLVQFVKLGRQGSDGGHVQVSAYGNNSDACKVERWDYDSSNYVRLADAPEDERSFDVYVRCFTAEGRPTDSRFTVLAGWPGGGGSIILPITDTTVDSLQEMIYDLQDQVEAIRVQLDRLTDE